MAALNRPTEATYAVHEHVTVDTADREDHTFCGIMFPVKCKELLPLDHVVINSVAVRGRLGPMSVWVSNEEQPSDNNNNETNTRSFHLCKRYWTKIYQQTHSASPRDYKELNFGDNPLILRPGQVRALYIHSTLPGDEAIVYDNRHERRTYDDALLSILPGRAHVSETPFGTQPIWGWGNAWRDNRAFVGRIEFGAVYKLWNPVMANTFGSKFQRLVRTLFLCQRRWESPMSMLPDDCIFYILNMCRWDWANDTQREMTELKTRRTTRLRREAEEEEAARRSADQNNETGARNDDTAAESAAPAVAALPAAAGEESTSGCCARACRQSHINNDDASNLEEDSDDDGDDEDYVVDSEDQDEDEDEDVPHAVVQYEELDDDDDDSDWEDDEADYMADRAVFVYHDDSDEEAAAAEEAEYERNRHAWFRRQFARIHVLRSLAALDDNAVVDMDF